MKKLMLSIVLLVMLVGTAFAYCTTDWMCYIDCANGGGGYNYCKTICQVCE